MKQRIKDFQKIWKSDYYFSTVFSSAISTLISIVFALYNGALEIVYQSWWHGLICVYYLLLATIRAILIGTRRKNQKTIRMITYLLLLVLDVSLIGPIYVMVSGERSYTYGLIPAIAMAVYTTYRITISIVHFSKSRKKDKSLLFELRMINMTDALVAVLSLQNALIIANGGMNEGMRTLTAWTSGGIYLVIVLITIMSFIKAQRS